jgi:hypothetical protein
MELLTKLVFEKQRMKSLLQGGLVESGACAKRITKAPTANSTLSAETQPGQINTATKPTPALIDLPKSAEFLYSAYIIAENSTKLAPRR